MKRIFSLTLAAVALAGNLKADPQIVIQSTHAEEDARAAAVAIANMPETFEQLYHLIAAAPHPSKTMEMFNQWRHPKAVEPTPLLEGDKLPQVSNLYDDEATIRLYLHDSGFTDISDIQIANVRSYMHAHGIRHVSELGQ